MPKRYKFARVTPIFKDGDHTDMNCYRPISVLPLLYLQYFTAYLYCLYHLKYYYIKRHVFDELYNYLVSHDMISPKQSGFRKHHSCQSLLLKISDYLLQGMDQGQISGLTLLGLRKASRNYNYMVLMKRR